MGESPEVTLLLSILDHVYDRRSWHGTNLRGSVRGLSLTQARWRPAPGRHNIWELVVHAAYWKYAVWRRLTGERRGSFPLCGSNWFRRFLISGAAANDLYHAGQIQLLKTLSTETRR